VPNWNQLLDEVRTAGSVYDVTRRKYLRQLYELTGRNVITYYSAWLQKSDLARQGVAGFELNDSDINGFMTAIHELDRTKGLDLLLHTPGGSTSATEALIDYLRKMFKGDIRAIVPQLAMSAGTMVALSCREILMGSHSYLGPIDPQIYGLPAHGIIEEFNRAADEIAQDQTRVAIWQPVIAKYNPTLIGECQKAIDWSNQMVRESLETCMFLEDSDAESKADRVIVELGDHALTLSHDRHISMERARDMGVVVNALEDNDDLQEAVLTVHHAYVQTLAATPAVKLIENHRGVAFVQALEILPQ
jgi:ATP-dependent protease ClpP protease subunit